MHTGRTLARRRLLTASAGALSAALLKLPGTAVAQQAIENSPSPVRDPASYTAYIPTASKTGPFFAYTCEFDAGWAVLKTFGIDATLQDQLDAIVVDPRVEPYYEWQGSNAIIHGGDITTSFSGDYTWNYLCRTTSNGFRPVFEQYGLDTRRVNSRFRIEHYLSQGYLIWIKTTVDFKDWVPATWITPEGRQLQVVLGNDHAMVVIGYNDEVVVIRDVLGPTDTNWQRPYEFEVPWNRFLTCWGAQGYDGLAVGRSS